MGMRSEERITMETWVESVYKMLQQEEEMEEAERKKRSSWTWLDEKWPGLKAICRIERIRELRTHCSREVIYVITSLPADKLAPAGLLQLARDHWQIENGLFHVRDVTFREDASRVRSGAAPEALADLRNAALNLIRRRKLKPRDAREGFAANKWTAIRLVMGS